MPFGLDLMSLIVGVLLGWFAVPYLVALISGARSRQTVSA